MSNESSTDKKAAPSKRPPVVPIVIVVAEAIALAGLDYAGRAEWLSPANAFLAKFSAAGLGVILLFLWFVFFAPVPRRARTIAGVLGLVVVAIGAATLRIEGVTGVHSSFVMKSPVASTALPLTHLG